MHDVFVRDGVRVEVGAEHIWLGPADRALTEIEVPIDEVDRLLDFLRDVFTGSVG